MPEQIRQNCYRQKYNKMRINKNAAVKKYNSRDIHFCIFKMYITLCGT